MYKITELAKEMLRKYKHLVNKNDFETFYINVISECDPNYSIGGDECIGELTDVFYKAGINPLKFMTLIPDYFLFNQSIDFEFKIPPTIREIGSKAFMHSNITHLIVPGTVNYISSDAFEYCSLEYVEIKEGVKTLGNFAFDSCFSLKEVIIPKSVHSIGVDIFDGCELDQLKVKGYRGSAIETYCKEANIPYENID